MALTGVVIDKNGKILSDEDLRKIPIDIQAYYDVVIPSRKRINDMLAKQREVIAV